MIDGCILINGTLLECDHSKAFKNWLRTTPAEVIKKVNNVIIDNWHGRILHPLMLTGMKELREFVISSGNLTGFAGDFPPLKNVQVMLNYLNMKNIFLLKIS